MALETGTYISDLVATNPTSTDPKSEGDNHLRLIKATLQATFPNVTGAVTLTQDQINAVGSVVGRNKIINGKMEIAQRGTSFPAAGGIYTLDRWRTDAGGVSSAVTVSQQSDAPSGDEFQASLRAEVTTADSDIAAGDVYGIAQRIEGYNARDLIGRDFTLSFWVRSSKTGVHCVSFSNTAGNRSFVVEYTINSANTWEKKTVTVAGGLITAGTWNWTTGYALNVRWALAAGTNWISAANSWVSTNALATANQVNCLDTIGNIFAITGVQLEVGSVATPFEHRPYGLELALCQRYYCRIVALGATRIGYGLNVSTTQTRTMVNFPVEMRTNPSSVETTGTAADYALNHGANTVTACSSVPAYQSATQNFGAVTCTVASGLTAGGFSFLQGVVSPNAYIGFSAEL